MSERMHLGQMVDLVKDKRTSGKDPNKPYVGLEDMRAEHSGIQNLRPSTVSTSVNSLFRRGDVLFGKLRPELRKCESANTDGYCSTDILVLRPKIGFESRYVGRVFQSADVSEAAIRTSEGTGMPRTSWDALSKFEIRRHALAEQRRIADILDTIDESIRSTESLISKLEHIRHSLVDQIISGYKTTQFARLGEFIQSRSSFIQTGPFGSQLHASDYIEDGVPVVMPQDIVDGEIRDQRIARCSNSKAGQLAKHMLKKGDILLSRRGDLSKCAVVTARQEGWLCGTGCLLLRPSPSVASYWLAHVYRHDMCQRQIQISAVGSTMANLNTSLVASLRIPTLDRAEQNKAVEIWSAQKQRIDDSQTELQKLKMIKLGLMADLLTGRARAEV